MGRIFIFLGEIWDVWWWVYII